VRALAVTALVLLSLVPAIPVPAQAPPPGQDWVVTADTLVSNETIELGPWNLTVRSGARLTLDNVLLSFNQTSSYKSGITVGRGARLTLIGCTVNPDPAVPAAFFRVYGELDAERSCMGNIGPSFDTKRGGINVLGGTASFRQCVFNDTFKDWEPVLVFEDSRITLEDTRFACNDSAGLYIWNSSVSLVNCTDEATGGIDSTLSDVTVVDCLFSYRASCSFYSSKTVMSGCGFGQAGGRARDAPPAAAAGRGANLTVEDCTFNRSYTGCLVASGFLSRPECSVFFNDPKESLVRGCAFEGDGSSIGAVYSPVTIIGRSTFNCKDYAVVCYDFTTDTLAVRENSVLGGKGIALSSGGGLVEGNTIRSELGHNGGMIDCSRPACVLRNTIDGPARPTIGTYGILLRNPSILEYSEVRGNNISGMGTGIYFGGYNNDDIVGENRVTASNYGVVVQSYGNVVGNTVESVDNGIEVRGKNPDGLPWRISDNTVRSGTTGINASMMQDASGRGLISNNTILGGRTGLDIRSSKVTVSGNRLAGQAQTGILAVDFTGDITGNGVSANETGISVEMRSDSHNPGSVDRNTVAGSRVGIALRRTDIAVNSNQLENISAWGIHGLDYTGDSGGNAFGPAAGDGACREGRFWSVRVTARYNANPPGDPENWLPAGTFHLLVTDRLGAVAVDLPEYRGQTLAVKGQHVWWNGTDRDYNPHQFTALADQKGVGRVQGVVDRPFQLELSLRSGPELHPLSLQVSPPSPVEGDLVRISATGVHNASFNPFQQPAPGAVLEIGLDGSPLLAKELAECLPGCEFGLSAAAIATPGWHNASFMVDSTHLIDELFEDNNLATVQFFVSAMPNGSLVSGGTRVACWEPVIFSVRLERSAGALAGVRFDFGDGNATEWSTALSATHAYTSPGRYTVRAWLSNLEGTVRECQNALNMEVSPPALELTIRALPDPARSGSPVAFSVEMTGPAERVVSGMWSFGDGGVEMSDARLAAGHTYAIPGNYTVELLVRLEDGSTFLFSTVVAVLNAPPQARLQVFPQNGTVATLFSFVSRSSDPDGRVVRIRWEFGDGGSSELPAPTHYYARRGVYTVNLTVMDQLGEWSAPAAFLVVVENTPPSARIGPVGGSAATGSELRFDGSGTTDPDDPPEALSYLWDFGDGSTATGARAHHAYSRPGRYTVTLTASDAAGGVSVRTVTVDVRQATGPNVGWEMPAAAVGALLAVSIIIYILLRILSHRHGDRPPPAGGGLHAGGRGRGGPKPGRGGPKPPGAQP